MEKTYEQKFLDRTQAAEYLATLGLKVARTTLQKFATIGGGPIYRRFGWKAVYLRADLDAWATARLTAPRSSTSQAKA